MPQSALEPHSAFEPQRALLPDKVLELVVVAEVPTRNCDEPQTAAFDQLAEVFQTDEELSVK